MRLPAPLGLAATVYEQAPQLTEVGAGLVVAPNAVRLLRRLGVMRHFLRHAVPLEWGWEFRRWENGAVLSAERLEGACERPLVRNGWIYGHDAEAAAAATRG